MSAVADTTIYRFIPACTGNSASTWLLVVVRSVHPRVYGELIADDRLREPSPGSSPRVRGTQRLIPQLLVTVRFIPACTGNSQHQAPKASPRSVHPRVYGELSFATRTLRCIRGSSPRVRGTLILPAGFSILGRFIPACTGNSVATTQPDHSAAVHPRVYGELSRGFSIFGDRNGSSPRVRGTLELRKNASSILRFIPACTGNSVRREEGIRRGSVHPRVYGELFEVSQSRNRSVGSSPRVRGTRNLEPEVYAAPRFIPACTGNSTASVLAASGSTVHPRVYGELRPSLPAISAAVGSSPRVRGTRQGA